MRSSSVLAFRAPRQRCSPGESGVADLSLPAGAAAPRPRPALPPSPRPPRRLALAEPAREFAPFVAAGVGGVRAGGIAEQRLTAPRRRRLDTRVVESAT